MIGIISSNFTQRASRRLSYAALLRIRSKKQHYDFTLRRLAYESLRLVQKKLKLRMEKLEVGIQRRAA